MRLPPSAGPIPGQGTRRTACSPSAMPPMWEKIPGARSRPDRRHAGSRDRGTQGPRALSLGRGRRRSGGCRGPRPPGRPRRQRRGQRRAASAGRQLAELEPGRAAPPRLRRAGALLHRLPRQPPRRDQPRGGSFKGIELFSPRAQQLGDLLKVAGARSSRVSQRDKPGITVTVETTAGPHKLESFETPGLTAGLRHLKGFVI